MIGWRGRLGFLLPPGNPTVEPEMIALAPQGVSVHFHRMTARGVAGSLEGQDERNRMMVDNIDSSIELLAMVKPDVIVLAHTATSYYLGREREAGLLARLERSTGRRVITAFGSPQSCGRWNGSTSAGLRSARPIRRRPRCRARRISKPTVCRL